MAINWPSLGQGAATGTTYTAPAPGSNVWTWSGYAWGSRGTTAVGGFGAPWVIFESSGRAKAYADLPTAISNANTGDTINLFNDTREYPTVGNYIVFDLDLNINLNGHTYILDLGYNPWIGSANIITNNLNQVKVRISNGTIKLTNVSSDSYAHLIGETRMGTPSISCEWNFYSATFEVDSGFGDVGRFRSPVSGGTFYNSGNGRGVVLVTSQVSGVTKNVFRDITATADNNTAIEILGGSNETTSFFINCKGYSNVYSEVDNFAGIVIEGNSFSGYTNNEYRLVGSLGANIAEGQEGIGYGIMTFALPTKVIHSFGHSYNGAGIYTAESTLIHCTGDGLNINAGSSFFSLGGSVLRRCNSGSNLNVIGYRSTGLLIGNVIGDKVENCNFNGTYGMYGPGGDSGNFINIFNCTIRGRYNGIYYRDAGYKTYIINSSIGPKASRTVPEFGNTLIPIYTGGTGSIIVNNLLEGGSDEWSIRNGTYAPLQTIRILIAGNTCINTKGISPFGGLISQGMTVPMSDKNLIYGQPL